MYCLGALLGAAEGFIRNIGTVGFIRNIGTGGREEDRVGAHGSRVVGTLRVLLSINVRHSVGLPMEGAELSIAAASTLSLVAVWPWRQRLTWSPELFG